MSEQTEETEETEEQPRRRGRRRKAEASRTEKEAQQLEAIQDRMGPPAEGMKRAIVTVAGLSIPDGNYTRVVRQGGVFDAPAEFVDRMAKLERCELV